MHIVKRGDGKTLRWDLGRDLSAVTEARVIIARRAGQTPVVDRPGVIESPAADGVVSLTLAPDDYGDGLLEAGRTYVVEVETEPGPLTHPDSGYEKLKVVADLG